MAYGDFKDLNRKTAADKVLCDEDPKYDVYQRGLASMVYKFYDKKSSSISFKNIPNKELAKELHRSIIRNFNKRNVHSPFIDNIWGADLATMQLLSKFNEIFRFLLCVIDIYRKYASAIPLKDKKGIMITSPFLEILVKSNRKPNTVWVDKGSEFHNRSMKSCLEKNEMYSMHIEEKSVIAERFSRTLKNKIYKHKTSVWKMFILIN